MTTRFVDAIDARLPGWAKRKPIEHWRKIAGVIAITVDALIEGVFSGRLAGMPGQVDLPGIHGLGGFDNVDALPLIGRDRRIVQGFTESFASYAAALRDWRNRERGWPRSGTPWGILIQLRRVLGDGAGGFPLVRIVSRAGYWHSIEPDGSFVFNTPNGDGFRLSPDGTLTAESDPAHPWDWDSATVPAPPDQDETHQFWIIIYPPCGAPLTGTEGAWGYGETFWGEVDSIVYGVGPSPSTGTWGMTSTGAHVEQIQGLVAEWKAAGFTCPWIVVAFDPASFDPITPGPYPASGMPDGSWGWDSAYTDTGDVTVTRLDTARYWRGHDRYSAGEP